MGAASSVSGVGNGSAYNGGSARMTLNSGHLLGTRVVAANVVQLSGTSLQVYFQQSLPKGYANYAIQLTGSSSTVPYVSAKSNDSNSDFNSFTITGGNNDTVFYTIVLNGFSNFAPENA